MDIIPSDHPCKCGHGKKWHEEGGCLYSTDDLRPVRLSGGSFVCACTKFDPEPVPIFITPVELHGGEIVELLISDQAGQQLGQVVSVERDGKKIFEDIKLSMQIHKSSLCPCGHSFHNHDAQGCIGRVDDIFPCECRISRGDLVNGVKPLCTCGHGLFAHTENGCVAVGDDGEYACDCILTIEELRAG